MHHFFGLLSSEIRFRLVPKAMDGSGAYKTTGEGSSPYSCLISTLADDDADYNYWNQSFWVHFSTKVEEQADEVLATDIELPIYVMDRTNIRTIIPAQPSQYNSIFDRCGF